MEKDLEAKVYDYSDGYPNSMQEKVEIQKWQ